MLQSSGGQETSKPLRDLLSHSFLLVMHEREKVLAPVAQQPCLLCNTGEIPESDFIPKSSLILFTEVVNKFKTNLASQDHKGMLWCGVCAYANALRGLV